jgi:hypothetical protein
MAIICYIIISYPSGKLPKDDDGSLMSQPGATGRVFRGLYAKRPTARGQNLKV